MTDKEKFNELSKLLIQELHYAEHKIKRNELDIKVLEEANSLCYKNNEKILNILNEWKQKGYIE